MAHVNDGRTPDELWADYENQVIATSDAWHAYEQASQLADARFGEYQAAVRLREDSHAAWQQANDSRNAVYDAYWATYDKKAA